MIDLAEITKLTVSLAKKAGSFIEREAANFSKADVELKGKSDLVSYVDKEAETLLVNGLKEIYPGAGFITEENTIEQGKKEYTWIIDPLDGTTNFVHGLPPFAVSIGLMHKEEMVSGVIFEINRKECFYAWKNGGAFLNGKKIHVSDTSSIEESLFATGFPIHNFGKLDDYLAILNELMKDAHGLRRAGSAAVDMAYVACGRYEAFFEYNLNSWDIAAGIVIVLEAGGNVSDFKGLKNPLFRKELVVAGPVHAELLKIIQKHWF